jgi:hypothetical protein
MERVPLMGQSPGGLPQRLLLVPVSVCLVALACSGEPFVPHINGNWHLQEFFEDEIHLVSCSGQGEVVVTQGMTGNQVTGTNSPDSTFSATAGVETDCTSLDGPFSYFGNGTFAGGVLTPGNVNDVRWEGTVNDAACQYEGLVRGDEIYGLEMSGTLSCVLVTPGVTFNFEGTWEGHSARSQWCLDRRELAGCT